MSPLARFRITVVGFALAGFVLQLGRNLAVDQLVMADRLPGGVFTIAVLGLTLLGQLAPIGGYLLVVMRGRPIPASFVATGDGFVAPASPVIGLLVVMAWTGAGGSSSLARVLGVGERAASGLDLATAGVFLALAVISGGWVLLHGPAVTLTPAGIEFRNMWRTGRVTWAEQAADALGTTATRLVLAVPRAGGQPRQLRIAKNFVHVAETFLTRASRHYAEHPEHRAAIGTEAELARLRAALSVGGPADPSGSARSRESGASPR
ncbi:hypothetical protein AB0B66_00165 [Catellatospora sp. NPDC049111]|uniref:hypothetical protein n=1 Tax=Catellatospora sp. NPDC049111 TaxID=3155271 RepID=UPI00340BD9E4